jgi:ABC-type branched-subunit amino acid transport system substrate-binding protein
MSNALTEPTSQLGLKLRKRSKFYFDKVNSLGGIHGRKVVLISFDDGYEPKNTVINTRILIKQEQVFALFGYVDPPTSHAILSILKQNKFLTLCLLPKLIFYGCRYLITFLTSALVICIKPKHKLTI